ncbi:hypothetical protein AA958_27055 [Streptomyces sp. CNQ-509]|nr:hypothetical protein AA958_27055 [Streptomyces sp. CNQ-509]
MFQLLALGRGRTVVAVTAVRLGLADPQPQGFLMDAQVLRDVRDWASAGADLADGALAELVGVLPWCWHLLVCLLTPRS